MLEEKEFVPYLIVLSFICFLLFLIYLRRALNVKAMETGIQIGNGQTIGRREEQDDYFSSVTVQGHTLAVVADGISGLANGRVASTVAVTTFIKEFMKLDQTWRLGDF